MAIEPNRFQVTEHAYLDGRLAAHRGDTIRVLRWPDKYRLTFAQGWAAGRREQEHVNA